MTPTTPPFAPLSSLLRSVASVTVMSLAAPVTEGAVRNARDAVAEDQVRAEARAEADRALRSIAQARRQSG
ncbi:MAG: hypothetical protein ACRDYU_01445 [Actinomycetes bacterium]